MLYEYINENNYMINTSQNKGYSSKYKQKKMVQIWCWKERIIKLNKWICILSSELNIVCVVFSFGYMFLYVCFFILKWDKIYERYFCFDKLIYKSSFGNFIKRTLKLWKGFYYTLELMIVWTNRKKYEWNG